MTRDPNHDHAQDKRTTTELVELYVSDPESDASDQALAIIQYRGGAEEFGCGARLARSNDEAERVLGAAILAQLGSGEFGQARARK